MIYCPTCEAGCSEKADVCPKCGHPLAAPVNDKIISLVTLRTSKPYIIATVAIGLIGIGAYVYVNAPRDPKRQLSEAQSSYIDHLPSAPSPTATGLGSSLADFQHSLPAAKGWVWSKVSSSNAISVVYKVTNGTFPNIRCFVTGPEHNIDKFSIFVTITERDLDDNAYVGNMFASLGLLSQVLSCNSDALLALMARSEKDFNAARIAVEHHETINGLDITTSWIPVDGGLVFVLAADAVPPASP